MRLITALPLMALLATTPALAQNPWEDSTSVEQAVARAIADAMPVSRYDWSLRWDAFGIRGGRDVFWHLYDPQPYYRTPLPEGVHKRTGWLSVNGRSGDVQVCGDADIISQLSFEVSDLWLGESDLIEDLAAQGVAATLTEDIARRPSLRDGFGDPHEPGGYYEGLIGRHPALRTWRLEQAEHEPVDLNAVYSCTPPGTRSATRCWMVWTVTFRPDERAEGAEPCLPPRRSTDD